MSRLTYEEEQKQETGQHRDTWKRSAQLMCVPLLAVLSGNIAQFAAVIISLHHTGRGPGKLHEQSVMAFIYFLNY